MPITEEQLLRVFSPKNTITVWGPKGSGKSNFACVLMELLVQLGYEIWTNIHFFGYGIENKEEWTKEIAQACNIDYLKKGIRYLQVPPQIHVFSELSELMYGLCIYGTKVVFLDEAGIIAESGTSSKTATIKRLATIIRHFDACMVNISALMGSVAPALREGHVDYEFNTRTEKRKVTIGQRVENTDEMTGMKYATFPVVKTWQKTPHTKLAHDSFFISDMVVDLDLKKLLEQLCKARSSVHMISGYGKACIDKLMEESPKHVADTTKSKIFKEFDLGNFNYDNLTKKYDIDKKILYVYKNEWKKNLT